MKNYSIRKAAGLFCLLLSVGWTASVHSNNYLRKTRGIDFLSACQTQQLISGAVADANGPIPGVTISIKGKQLTTISDADGRFTIAATVGETLVFTSIGYQNLELTVTDAAPLKITLQDSTTDLKEVTVNAGYYTVKDKERTGSIARITSKDIDTQPVTNVLATMQGRMAGVNVTQTTGSPGGGFDIEIRGRNSLRPEANAPLYIIDGVPYSSEGVGSNLTSNIFGASTSPLNSINPDAIDSIEVLKDADATAIYGSRGANGVVLITTKKGKAGKTRFAVNATTGVGRITRFMKLMDTQQYLDMREQAFINDGVEYSEWDYDVNGTWDRDRYTDWQKELVGGTAEYHTLDGTVSGGSDRTQFLVGGTYHSETTVFPGDFRYRKGGVNLNINHRSEDGKFRLTASANYVAQNNNLPAYDLTNDSRRLSPNAPALYDEEGNLNFENSTFSNPIANLYAQHTSRTNDLVGNAVLSYEILADLDLKSSFGYTNTRHLETRTMPSTMYDPAFGAGPEYSALLKSNVLRNSWIAEPQLAYKRGYGKLEVNALAGGSFQQQVTNRLTQRASGFTSNSLIYDISAAANQRIVFDNETVYKYQAFFGRLNLNYDQKYILNVTARRDGSSRFGPGKQFANFGAVGAAWLFSNESFLKDNSVVSFGKLRASYGSSGNDQIGDYQFLDTYSSTGVMYQGVVGLTPTRLYNPDFAWETNRKLEAALELGFFKDRVSLTVAAYRNRSSNQLIGIPLPATTGFSSLQANLDATVENTGWEFSFRTVNVSSGSFKWISNFNVSLAKNKLLAYPGLEGSTYRNLYRIGEPLNVALLYHYTGIDNETGLYTFEDINGDGVITSPEDQQTVKDLNPEYFGGFQNQLTYKNWSLDFLFQFVKRENYSYGMGNGGLMTNQPARLTDSWQQPGDTAAYQILTAGFNGDAINAQSQYDNSDAIVVHASYIRLKNIALSYDVPLHLKDFKCRLSVNAQNLFTLTNYDDGDPEFSRSGYLPPLKVVTGGIQLTF